MSIESELQEIKAVLMDLTRAVADFGAGATGTDTAVTPPKAKRKKKNPSPPDATPAPDPTPPATPAPEPETDDPFGADTPAEPPKEIDIDFLKARLQTLTQIKSFDIAFKILQKIGKRDHLSEVDSSVYPAILEAVEAALVAE